MSKPRIAILGGGAGAVTAAFHLSKPGWERHFDSITIYQQGWRLGGKGASGRGTDDRIEEHGLHIWFGFYENAFSMLGRCHQELDTRAEHHGQPRWPLAFDTMKDSFLPCTDISVTDYDGCGWKMWVADFFDYDDDVPWAEDHRAAGERPEDWSVVFYLVRCLELAADLAGSLVRPDSGVKIVAGGAPTAAERPAAADEAFRALRSVMTGDLRVVLNVAAETLDTVTDEVLKQPLFLDLIDLVVRALDFVVDFLRIRYDDFVRSHDDVRRAWYVVDVLIAIVRGVIEDGVIEEDSFAVIDDIDFRDWLLLHGATRDSVDCALIRAVVYDLAFGFEDGDPERPACGAGTAVRGLLRTLFTYRGALMWKMGAGMGDVVFAPLYELLVKRGVNVNFFHRIESVRVADGQVEEIEIDVQAAVPDGTPPSAYLGATPGPRRSWSFSKGKAVWPAAPHEFVKGSKAADIPPEAFESWYIRDAAKGETKTLRRGAKKDGFEEVVFGLPISCVPYVAPGLVSEYREWKAAVDHLRTVPTQAMQLWLNETADVLGAEPEAVVGGFVEPFDTWADMPHLVSQENVGSQTVAYFCNVLPDAPPPGPGEGFEWLDHQRELVRVQAMRFLTRDIGTLWPKAVDRRTGAFDWGLLVDPKEREGEDRLNAQYLRANVEPSERYVLSVPGSSAHRIPPANTGIENLFAVGDWTSCKLDAGCVEAAVISGMLAANGIHEKHNNPDHMETVIGWHGP